MADELKNPGDNVDGNGGLGRGLSVDLDEVVASRGGSQAYYGQERTGNWLEEQVQASPCEGGQCAERWLKVRDN